MMVESNSKASYARHLFMLIFNECCLRYLIYSYFFALGKKDTIHQVTTKLATPKNVLFPGHNHLLTTSADDHSL